MNKLKSIHGIVIPTTSGYQHYGGKTGFGVRAMFAQYYFTLLVNHNILYHFLLDILSFHIFSYFGRRYNKDNKL